MTPHPGRPQAKANRQADLCLAVDQQEEIVRVVELAKAFASALSDEQLSHLNRHYPLPNAANVLLAAVTGSGAGHGYDKIQQHLSADDYLREHGGGAHYGRGNFYLAFLGTPSDSGMWELQFGGHHLAVANTYLDGVLVGATPSFVGIEPFPAFQYGGVSNRPELPARDAFAALLASFGRCQLAQARLPRSYRDLPLGPGRDWAFPARAEGIADSALSGGQKALLMAAVAAYTGDVDDENAATILAGYEKELDSTHVGYAGSARVSKPGDYVRVDGPSVWIEFLMHSGVVLENPHPHAVWRDKATDYGGTAR
jgi:hypothetical protein